MTSNVHQLQHLPKSVVQQGPLWAHSCFSFECNIGSIKRLVTSARCVPMQIVERLMMSSNYRAIKARASPRTRGCLLSDTPARETSLLLSKPRAVSGPLLGFVQNEAGDTICSRIVEHDRLTISGRVFHSEQYSRPYKTDSTALMTGVGTFHKILHIVSFKDAGGIVKVFTVSGKFLCHPGYDSSHIMRCEKEESRHLVELTSNVKPCIYIEHEGNIFFVKLALKTLSVG